MIKTGVEKSMKALKRIVEKGEKVYRLIEGVGKEKLERIEKRGYTKEMFGE
ncbi:hypothetical protein C1646_774438 [Rhizophagus diaphanus]|nr:hypothetical protein C1646_774438 [Rhizophagus diaphanus] [Rhizophagus sp. MUCL 43196]